MKRFAHASSLAATTCFMLLSLGFEAQAAISPCNIANQPAVIFDLDGSNTPNDNGNGGTDLMFSLSYDDGVVPTNNPGTPSFIGTGTYGANVGGLENFTWTTGNYPVNTNNSQVNVSVEGSGLSDFAKSCGSLNFNSATVATWHTNTLNRSQTGPGQVSGMLVDTDNDGIADSISLLLDFYMYVGLTGLFDMPLQYYPNSANPTHLMIPNPIPAPGGINIDTDGAWFIPVDAASRTMTLNCPGGIGPFTINDTAYATSGQICSGHSIPLSGGWGSALLVLGLLGGSLWAMRRSGMGKGIALS
jgi:hypothetical protein